MVAPVGPNRLVRWLVSRLPPMNNNPQETTSQGQRIAVNDNLTCEECGAFGAIEWDGKRLCPECSTAKGSCCPEFGKDDLWSDGTKNRG